MSRPLQNHADLGLVDNDQTPFIRKAAEARPARTASEAIDHTPIKEHALTIVAHHQTDLHDVQDDLSDIAPAPTAAERAAARIEAFNSAHEAEEWTSGATWMGAPPEWATSVLAPLMYDDGTYLARENEWASAAIKVPVLAEPSSNLDPGSLDTSIVQGIKDRAPRIRLGSRERGMTFAKLEIPEARALAAALTLLADIAEAA